MTSLPQKKPIVEVNHVTKEFRLGQLHTLKQSVADSLRRLRGIAVQERAPFKALDDIDFKVDMGEVVGIIGANGSGKSTLLKLLAGITSPTRGTIAIRGKVAPLIEVGAGLIPDLTGRENIFLNASILGMKRAEVAKKFDEIVTFAELDEFIDTPIKRYSSGMQVRLGFSIATTVEADILIVDEVLAVGDLAFQRKCFDRMEDMIKRKGRTVLLVSHNIRQVERICTRVMLLERGKILQQGSPTDVCNLFYKRSDQKIRTQSDEAKVSRKGMNASNSGEIELLSISLLDAAGNKTTTVEYGSDIIVSIVYRAHVELVNAIFGVGVHTTDLLYLADKATEDDNVAPRRVAPGTFAVHCQIKNFPLLPGVYSLRIGVAVGTIYRIAFYAEGVYRFDVIGKHRTRPQGFVALDTHWNFAELTGGETAHFGPPGSASSTTVQQT